MVMVPPLSPTGFDFLSWFVSSLPPNVLHQRLAFWESELREEIAR